MRILPLKSALAEIEGAIGPLPSELRSTMAVAFTVGRLRRVSVLADLIRSTPRQLGRVCTRARLPTPKHWLLLAHGLHIADTLTHDPAASFTDIAQELGYPDEFSLSRAMWSGLGCRLSDLRRDPRPQLVIARWVARHPRQLSTRPIAR